MTGGFKIPISASLDTDGADQALKAFQADFNRLGDSIAKMNKLTFSPIDKATIGDLQRVHSQMEALKKIHGDLRSRMKATGQEKSDLFGIDWSKLYPDQNSRAKQMRKVFEYVGGNFQGAATPPAGPPKPPGGGGGANHPPPSLPGPPGGGGGGGGGGGAGRNIVGAGLNAMGPYGGVANRALSTGMSGGVGAGLAGLAGGAAALLVGKLIGAVREKIGSAQQEFIGYDTLKRQLGDVNVSFGTLRSSLREASRGLDMTFEEGQRLGAQFVKLSGVSGEQAKSLGEEVSNAGGFARSFGSDPGSATGFFAQMRLSRVTQDVNDSRRIGLVMGEAIAKSGAFSQVDVLLEAVASFTSTQTRQGLNAANVTGYTGALAGLVGSGVAGLDPASAAQLLGRVNSSIAGGGGAGEAGQNFLYSAIGSRLGLNPIQTAIMREQGAFGTGSSAFGKDSMYAKFADKYKLSIPGGAAGSSATNLQLIMDQMERVYAKQPELMVNAMSNLFGVNNSQAMALATIDSKSLGGLAERLKSQGINLNDINSTGISRIAQIEADGSLSNDEKNRRVRDAATKNQEETEGTRTRATINGVERAVQNAAGQTIGVLNDIRSATMWLAGESGKRGPRGIMEAVARAESAERVGLINGEYDPQLQAADREKRTLAGRRTALTSSPMVFATEAERLAHNEKLLTLEREEAANREKIGRLTKERADKLEEQSRALAQSINAIRTPQKIDPHPADSWGRGEWSRSGAGDPRLLGRVDGAFGAEASMEGLTPEQTRLANSIYQQESGGGRNTATSINGAVGGMQMLPSTFKAFSDPGWDINNPEHNRRAGMRYIKHLWGKSGGNARTAAGAYYGGEKAIGPNGTLREFRNLKRPSDPSTLEYADEVMGRIRGDDVTPLPEDRAARDAAAAAEKQRLEISGTFYLNDGRGNPAAAPVQFATSVRTPQPSGLA